MIKFITTSSNKFNEAKAIIPELEQVTIELDEIQELDPKKVIGHKVKEAFTKSNGPFVVDDSGLYLEAFNGFPGPLTKWFMGKAIANEELCAILEKSSLSKKAKAICMLGFATSSEEITFFEGVMEGLIVKPRGDGGFGFDPVFEVAGYGKTTAEITQEEKSAISHRGEAFRKLRAYLDEKKLFI